MTTDDTVSALDADTEGHLQADPEVVTEAEPHDELADPTAPTAPDAAGGPVGAVVAVGAVEEADHVDEDEPPAGARAGSSELHLRTVELFTRMGESTEVERVQLRSDLVELHLPLAEYLARRFGNRGEPHEDLVQVATIGLIKAIDRFDLERGVAFSTYATPTIVGEIKRHFRDRGWTIRVPRRLQEIQAVINQAVSDLGQELGRSPTVSELATRVGMSEEEILEGLESANAYSPLSLDAPDPSGELGAVIDQLGDYDDALDAVIDRETVKPLLDRLDARAKRILLLRFFRNMTQSQIAEELGISQMHVSRLLSRTLADLRRALEEANSSGS